ncbi:MAG: PspC domain-containing protein [Janthinobacterium lividum]
MNGQLLRPRFDRKIAGVCAAFARAYGWDLTLVRLALVALVVFGGTGLLAYVLCWIVIPEDPIALPTYPPAAYPPSGYSSPAEPSYPPSPSSTVPPTA